MFHLTTHRHFQSAAVIWPPVRSSIALHEEQDIWKMGGLRKDKMGITFWTAFLVGSLALSGVPPFSGFLLQRFHPLTTGVVAAQLPVVRCRCFCRRFDGVLHVPAVLRRFLRQGKIQGRASARARIAAGDDVAARGAGGVALAIGLVFIPASGTTTVRSSLRITKHFLLCSKF